MTRRNRGPFGVTLHEHHVKVRKHYRDDHWLMMLHSPHEQGRVRPNDGGWQRGEHCIKLGMLAKRSTRRLMLGWYAQTCDRERSSTPICAYRYEAIWNLYCHVNRN